MMCFFGSNYSDHLDSHLMTTSCPTGRSSDRLGLVGALTIPALSARLSNPFPIVLACAACHFGGFAGLLLAPMAAPLLWVPLVGLGPSTFPLGLTLINLRTRTPAGSASLSGFMQGVEIGRAHV